jgi:Xaa-Pro aminopeptidase
VDSDPQRLAGIRERLAVHEMDGLLVGSSSNRQYLSGFTGSDGWLLITRDVARLAVDFRYVEQAARESAGCDPYAMNGNITGCLPALIRDFGINRLGVESDHLSVSQYQSICAAVREAGDSVQVIPAKDLVESLRSVKDGAELDCISAACELADLGIEYAYSHLRAGLTECQLAWEIEREMRERGSQSLPFEIIVASGPNSAMPHARPTDKVICPGEPITIDLGARHNGYCSDLTRTFVWAEADDQFNKVHNIVLAAQLTGLSLLKSGLKASAADGLARTVIERAGFGEQFGHGLGHGVGIDVHEMPRLGIRSEDVLEDGMVFTIEPGIYVRGWGGIRIEDTIMLRDGKAVCLTRASKQAIVHGG